MPSHPRFPFAGLVLLALFTWLTVNPTPALADPTEDELLYRAKTLYAQKQYMACVDAMSQAIARNPMSSRAYFQRGDCEDELGQTTQALADLDRATALDPAFSEAYRYKAIIYGRDPATAQQALDFYAMALQANPGNAKALTGRAKLEQKLNLMPEACRDYKMLCGLGPCNELMRAYVCQGVQPAPPPPPVIAPPAPPITPMPPPVEEKLKGGGASLQ